ncbi:MAG: hypothetical protein H7337_11330 [Rhizobacter sp.]|nr:hypothetical protein [Rhizobacter sp.]
MRASPALHVSLRRFSAWRAAVLALTLAGLVVTCAWLLGREAIPVATLAVGMVCSTLALVCLGFSLGWVPAADLCWDGQGWSLKSLLPIGADPVAGDILVAIDLGAWMLLRFRPAIASPLRRPIWLPIQRWGIEPQWHALRCAVHAPRPRPAAEAPRLR